MKMDTMINASELCLDLRNRIKMYKKDHSYLNSTQIAKRFNMSPSALNRIENCDVKTPAIDQVIKILKGTGSRNELLDYIEKSYPIVSQAFKEEYSSSEKDLSDLGVEYYLNDKDKYRIILLALIGNGTSRVEIKEEFGSRGLKELDFLISKGVLPEVNGRIGDNDRFIQFSFPTLKTILARSIEDCLKIDGSGQGMNYVVYRAYRVNRKKVYKRINGILEDADNKIQEVLNEKESAGNDDMFYGLVTDSICSIKENQITSGEVIEQ